MLDPHTAVAVKVAKKFQRDDTPMLVASTAHYSKFIEECKDVYEQIGITSINNPPLHKGIENCKVLETVHTDVVEGDYQKMCHVLESFIEEYFG